MSKIIAKSDLKKDAKKIAKQIGISESEAYNGLVSAAKKKGYVIAEVIKPTKEQIRNYKENIKKQKLRISKKTPRLR